MFRIAHIWIPLIVIIVLFGSRSTEAYLCMCSTSSCVLIHPNTDFFKNAESFCSTFRVQAHDISIIKLMDTELSPDAFIKFPNMTSLEIFQGQLENIDSETFRGTGNLVKLLIRGNGLTSLDDYTFKGADNLKELTISANPLDRIAENAFANLRQLEILVLTHGEITFLPSKVFHNNRLLKSISLNSNKIQTIDPEVFTGLDDLTKLELPENKLKVFDFQFLRAAVVVLNNNSLEHLAINEHCSSMYASNNEIKTISINGNNLSKLSVINNRIRDITNITKISNLTSLSLGSNPLEINTVFSSLPSLEELMLQSTYINLTEETFANLRYLKVLDLSYNNLTVADFKIFQSLSSLHVLSFVGNQIPSFNYIEAREYLPRLRVLEICKNGWSNTYFETNIIRMKRFQLSPDIHGFSSHFLFRDDYINLCSEKLVEDYNYDDFIEQPIDVEDEIRASFPKEATTKPMTTTTKTTTASSALKITTTPVPTATDASTKTTVTTQKTTPQAVDSASNHHVLEYNADTASPKMSHSEPVQAASPFFITFQVLVYILSVIGLVSLVAAGYLWKKRQLNARSLTAAAESTDSVRLI